MQGILTMIDIKNLTLFHPAKSSEILLSDLTLQIANGERWCILGQNGAGKSTLLRVLAGMDAVALGSIQIQGQMLGDLSPLNLARLRAYCAQQTYDFFSSTVLETLVLARYPHQNGYFDGSVNHEISDQFTFHPDISPILKAMGLETLLSNDIRCLSGGERQRVALAAAIAQLTPFIFLDEPFSFLDLRFQRQALEFLFHLSQATPARTLIMALHDFNQAAHFCTHALLLLGQGCWLAGPCAQVLTVNNLSDMLQIPVYNFSHQGKFYFVPAV